MDMRKGMLSLVALAGTTLAASGTQAAIFFTFDDPSAALEVQYSAPTMPGQLGQLSYNTAVPIQFVVDATEEGATAPVTFDAIFSLNSQVSPVVTVGPGAVTASVSGQFEFRRQDNNQLILSGSYQSAILFVTSIVGSLLADGTVEGGSLSYAAGPAMEAGLAGVDYDLPAFNAAQPLDGVWTLTAISQVGFVQVGQDRFLNNFNANAAFTGTVRVPTPGAAALAGMAGLMCFGRRKR